MTKEMRAKMEELAQKWAKGFELRIVAIGDFKAGFEKCHELMSEDLNRAVYRGDHMRELVDRCHLSEDKLIKERDAALTEKAQWIQMANVHETHIVELKAEVERLKKESNFYKNSTESLEQVYDEHIKQREAKLAKALVALREIEAGGNVFISGIALKALKEIE